MCERDTVAVMLGDGVAEPEKEKDRDIVGDADGDRLLLSVGVPWEAELLGDGLPDTEPVADGVPRVIELVKVSDALYVRDWVLVAWVIDPVTLCDALDVADCV